MEVRQADSVVMVSMPFRKSMDREWTPGPTNSRTLFFTKPFLNTAPMRVRATSMGPTQALGAPVRYTPTTWGYFSS